MKRTLQVVSAALLLTVASVTAQAQGGGGGGGGGRGMGGGRGGNWETQKTMLLKDITLSAAQTTSIDSIAKIATDANAKLMADMQAGGGMTDEMRTKRTAITTERNDAIKKILTADQVKQFETNLAAMSQGRGRGGL